MKSFTSPLLQAIALFAVTSASCVPAQIKLIAKGTLTGSAAGPYADLSGLPGTLENNAPANLLGGLGSGLAWVYGDRFLALPDRGPNAVSYNSAVDDTDSYIARFHTVKMNLQPSSAGAALPFIITPTLEKTTLLSSPTALTYGSGAGLGVGPGAPAANYVAQYFFTGRSDNYDPNQNSGNPADARLDPESIRVSTDGLSVFISDEYGPYIYQFNRIKGTRMRSFPLPSKYYVTNLSPNGATEISGNTSGRTANKGLEGLAITPDGKPSSPSSRPPTSRTPFRAAPLPACCASPPSTSTPAPPTNTPTASPPAQASVTSSPSTVTSSSSTSATAKASATLSAPKPKSSSCSKSTSTQPPTSATWMD